MNNTNILLDKYMATMQVKTKTAAGAKLGVTRSSIYNWQQGVSHAEPELVQKMAIACGLDPEEWVLRIQADREIKPERKQVWLRCANRLAATAALIAITFATTQTSGRLNGFSQNHPTMYIMSNLKRTLRNLRKLASLLISRIGKGMPDALSVAL